MDSAAPRERNPIETKLAFELGVPDGAVNVAMGVVWRVPRNTLLNGRVEKVRDIPEDDINSVIGDAVNHARHYRE